MTRTLRLDQVRGLLDEKSIVFEGFDEAIYGVSMRHTQVGSVVYDRDLLLRLLTQRDGLTLEQAEAFVADYIESAWVGPGTPLVMDRVTKDDGAP